KPRAPRKKKVHAVAGAAPAMPSLPSIPRADLDRLLAGEHSSPHSILGAHPATLGGEAGIVVRALIPNAVYVECVFDDGRVAPLTRDAEGPSAHSPAPVAALMPPAPLRFRLLYPARAARPRTDPSPYLPPPAH